jgi:ribonuclease-3 family protein
VTAEEEELSRVLKTNRALSWTEVRFSQLSSAVDCRGLLHQVPPASLAYLGDAVYELYIRTRYLLPPKRISDYHGQVVAQVRAESQANIVRSLEPHLTDSEL